MLGYSIFCILNNLINIGNCDVMMSIRKQGRVHLWVCLLNDKSFGKRGKLMQSWAIVLGKCLHDLED